MGFNAVGKTSDQSKIAGLAKEFSPELLLLDHDMSSNGMAKELKEQLPEMKILVLGYQEAVEEFVDGILKAGFDGFWNKYDTHAGFLKSLEALFP